MTVPRSFRTSAAFRAWLLKNHDAARELTLRLFKVHASHRGIGYREALDEALCFGWIDGVRRSLDEDSFTQRFTPRKAKSNWSAVNLRRVKELEAEGRMHPSGTAAVNAHDGRPAPYSFESAPRTLAPDFLRTFRAKKRAFAFFEAQPPGYRRLSAFWVMSAKRPETRASRFGILLECSARGARIPLLDRP
ncbi:MAG: YdeI/OmpD-associated family protein [Gemmatimonadaceae bacterium]